MEKGKEREKGKGGRREEKVGQGWVWAPQYFSKFTYMMTELLTSIAKYPKDQDLTTFHFNKCFVANFLMGREPINSLLMHIHFYY
jgi:hypothetical protein